MTRMIVLNHKMNLVYPDIKEYINELLSIKTNYHIILSPSNLYLLEFAKNKAFTLASQDAYYEDLGKFTGEVSSLQLKSIGIKYQIVGHSERRDVLNETNEIINKKIISCFRNDIIPILCIGETLEEYQEGNVKLILNREIQEALIGIEEIKEIIIAYEPKWAIGSNKPIEKEELTDIVEYIYHILKEGYKINPSILYGGSIDEKNIESIINIPNIDGVLIGDASINIPKLKQIINKIN